MKARLLRDAAFPFSHANKKNKKTHHCQVLAPASLYSRCLVQVCPCAIFVCAFVCVRTCTHVRAYYNDAHESPSDRATTDCTPPSPDVLRPSSTCPLTSPLSHGNPNPSWLPLHAASRMSRHAETLVYLCRRRGEDEVAHTWWSWQRSAVCC